MDGNVPGTHVEIANGLTAADNGEGRLLVSNSKSTRRVSGSTAIKSALLTA